MEDKKIITEKHNNETYGISLEFALCKLFNLEIPPSFYNRVNDQMVEDFLSTLRQLKLPITFNDFVGDRNSNVDFKVNDYQTLSVKTVKTKGNKICPQTIGQPTFNSWKRHFNFLLENQNCENKGDVKRIISQNLNIFLPLYWNHIFCCDWLLIYIIENNRLVLFNGTKKKTFEDDRIKLSKDVSLWNEGICVKTTEGGAIGEFQIHNNRDCIKFRFYLKFILENTTIAFDSDDFLKETELKKPMSKKIR